MIKPRLILINFFIFVYFSTNAQVRKCAIGETVDSTLAKRYKDLQKVIESYENSTSLKKLRNTSSEIINIPVVVHVIHKNSLGTIGGPTNSNISDEQIFSQIKVLNNDFRKAAGTLGFNNNPVGADMEINFYLATKTPEGLPSNGINRVYSPQKSFDVFKDNLTLSNLSYWDSNRYLNIWVTTLTSNYIGYAEFPSGNLNGLELTETNEKTDGVIISHTAFGNKIGTAIKGVYTFGRTLTHEVGHWLGLLHIWGDSFCGDDFCDDTPTCESSNNTISCSPITSNCKGVRTQNMIENFMDYTPDSCMNIFTNAQKSRVRVVFEVAQRRQRLLKSSKLNFSKVEEPNLVIFNNPSFANEVRIQAQMPYFQDFEIKIYTVLGKKIFEKNYIDYPGIEFPLSEANISSGIYFIVLNTIQSSITKRVQLF